MRCMIVLACLAMAGASGARADGCSNTQTQSAMNICADQSFRAANTELNALYAQIQRRLKADAGTGKLLTSAQRAWVAFRDGECKFSTSGVSGGSIYPMIYAGCAERLTRSRIDDFKTYLKCPEGDLGCPVPPG